MTGRAYTTTDDQSVNAEREALRTLRAEIRDTLLGISGRISTLEAWGTVMMHLGSSNDVLDHDAVAVVGQAVHDGAANLKADWLDACARMKPLVQA